MVSIILEIWREFKRPGHVDDKRIEDMLVAQDAFEQILHAYKYEPFLPRDKAEELLEHVNEILRIWSLLANSVDERHAVLWPTRPSLHYLFHLGLRARFLNPRVGNCMLDESYLKICKDIVQSVANGTPASLVPTQFMEKYSRGMTFELLYGSEYHS